MDFGNLYEEFEKLKAKLNSEGLFDEAHKKKIPFMPRTIGVLTASTGAVIRDIINVGTRRNPKVNIKLYPVPVQGPTASAKIVEAIEFMNKNKMADVLIIGRGGGSLEDLWPFNEECVARAIYNSEIPIISAVGHETDFTIADFVADLRAPTPSAAAELAIQDIEDVKASLNNYNNRYKIALKKKLQLVKLEFEKCMTRQVFTNPLQRINEQYMIVDMKVKDIQNSIQNKIKESRSNFVKEVSKLDALSPLKTLTRGYSITSIGEGEKKKIITSSKQLKKDDEVEIRFSDGARLGKILE